MNMKYMLLMAAVSAAFSAGAAVFNWQPAVSQPNPAFDVNQMWQLETLSFNVAGASSVVSMTDVMPVWIDEDGNEIKAMSGCQDPWGWDPSQFEYSFDTGAFKANGEYILLLPQGMLVDASGSESAKVEIPYSFDIPELSGAMFDDFSILSVSPDLTQPQGLWSNLNMTIDTNHNDAVGFTMLTVTDLTADEVVLVSSNYATGRVPGDTAPISWEVAGNHKFFEGHEYRADLVFYNGRDIRSDMGELTPVVDRRSYVFTGKVEAYRYSDVELLEVDPAPEGYLISEPSQAVFHYVFSAPVNVYKAETPLGSAGANVYPSSCLSSNADRTEWTLDLSDDVFVKSQDASLLVGIFVRDLEGYQLKGNAGYEDSSGFQFTWKCELGANTLTVTVPAEGETCDRLSEVVVRSDNGEDMAWSWDGVALIRDLSGNVVGTLVYELPDNSRDIAAPVQRFSKWIDSEGETVPIDLVRKGDYEVVLAPSCFIFGEQFKTKASHSEVSAFHISGNSDDPVSVGAVDATSACDVFDLQGRCLLRGATADDIRSLAKGIYIAGGKKIVVN